MIAPHRIFEYGRCNNNNAVDLMLRTLLIGSRLKLALLGLGLAGVLQADEGAIDYRQHTMAAVGGHMQAAVDILRQKYRTPIIWRCMPTPLQSSQSSHPRCSPTAQPAATRCQASGKNADDFATRLDDFTDAAAAFAEAAEGGDAGAIGTAFQGLGQACKACHDDYRAQ